MPSAGRTLSHHANPPRDTAWMAEGACRGVNPRLFSPGPGDHGQEARAVCTRCRVWLECLFYALRDPDCRGIWGRTNQTERDQLRDWDKAAARARRRDERPRR